jgi:hypothetical protein
MISVGLCIQSLNELIDLHAKRVQAGLRSRIPGAIWVGLFAVAALSLTTMGYHAGDGWNAPIPRCACARIHFFW